MMKQKKNRRKIRLWVAQMPDVGICEGISDGPKFFSRARKRRLREQERIESKKRRPYHDLMSFPADITLFECLKQTCFKQYADVRLSMRLRHPWNDDQWNLITLRDEGRAEVARIRKCLRTPIGKLPRRFVERAIFLAVCRRWAWETG